MTKKDVAYVAHILESIEHIEKKFAEPEAKQQFMQDIFFRYGVYYILQTLSESAWRLSDDIKKSAPEIEWKKIWNFRNVMAHDYLGDIEPNTILKIIGDYLPELKKSVMRLKGKL